MYKMINLCQKPKVKEKSSPTVFIKINEAEVKRIMGKNYSIFIESRNKIYEAIE